MMGKWRAYAVHAAGMFIGSVGLMLSSGHCSGPEVRAAVIKALGAVVCYLAGLLQNPPS